MFAAVVFLVAVAAVISLVALAAVMSLVALAVVLLVNLAVVLVVFAVSACMPFLYTWRRPYWSKHVYIKFWNSAPRNLRHVQTTTSYYVLPSMWIWLIALDRSVVLAVFPIAENSAFLLIGGTVLLHVLQQFRTKLGVNSMKVAIMKSIGVDQAIVWENTIDGRGELN